MTAEDPRTVHGRLKEAIHISGYTRERACGELEWLLEDNRWQQTGPGFTNINAFLATLNLSEFRLEDTRRKPLSAKLAALQASQSQTARTLGVKEITIARDLGKPRTTTNVAPKNSDHQKAETNNSDKSAIATNVVADPWFGVDADPTLEAKRLTRRQASDAARERRRNDANDVSDGAITGCDIACRDIRTDYAELSGVNAIITDPPYIGSALPLYESLAQFAARTLTTDGVCAVMTGHLICPEVIGLMRKYLPYRWMLAYLMPGGQAAQMFTAKVNTFWKPILLFGATRDWLGDVVRSATNDNDKRFHSWGQSESGMQDLITRLTQPGDLVCDPFLGGGTTAVVCCATGRRFIGGDLDGDNVKQARARCFDRMTSTQSDPNGRDGETRA
jgi:site-specific DNA-methyltransferase (adenine-specific)